MVNEIVITSFLSLKNNGFEGGTLGKLKLESGKSILIQSQYAKYYQMQFPEKASKSQYWLSSQYATCYHRQVALETAENQ